MTLAGEEDLEIPAFLDCRNLTPEQKAKRLARHKRFDQQEKRAKARAAKEEEAEWARRCEERQRKIAAKEKRKEDRAAQAARRTQKLTDRATGLRCIERRKTTVGQMSKEANLPTKRLQPAIRWLMKSGAIEKSTARTYKIGVVTCR